MKVRNYLVAINVMDGLQLAIPAECNVVWRVTRPAFGGRVEIFSELLDYLDERRLAPLKCSPTYGDNQGLVGGHGLNHQYAFNEISELL